jgi:hypothetical protein
MVSTLLTDSSVVRIKGRQLMSANVNRKAYFFSGASGLLLISFAVLYQLGLSPFQRWLSYLILGVLVIATALPLITRKWCEDNIMEQSFSQFADLIPPAKKEFSFEVPSLPVYKKVQLVPARIASALAGMMILLMFGGGSIIGNMLESSVPFGVFAVIAGGFVLLSIALIVLFVSATSQDLRHRQNFYDEVITGLSDAGYSPVREFNAEVIDDRRVLVTDGHDRYSWWNLKFDGDTAQMEWADTRKDEADKLGFKSSYSPKVG